MIRLLRLVHLPFWRHMPLQALLPALGIALGVGAIIAIDLGSASTVSSFRRTIQSIDGRTTHQVVGRTEPLDGRLAYELSSIPGVTASAPVVEAMALIPGDAEDFERLDGSVPGEPLRLLGLDPFAENGVRQLGADGVGWGSGDTFARFLSQPGALVISAPLLERHGLAPGDSLDLAVGTHLRRAFVLEALPRKVGEVRVPDNLALCDLATAQELTGRDYVSRIDLVLDEGRTDETVRAIESVLPEAAEVATPGGRTARLVQMVSALRTNLSALSYLALFVSLFLIYNAMLLAVLRRRSQIGIVRCLGATRNEVMGAWLLEAVFIGILGTGLGLLLGMAGSGFALQGVSRTASDLYGYIRADTLELAGSSFLKAGIVGLSATLVAALVPAVEAARTTPVHTAYRGEVEEIAARRRSLAPWVALPLLVLAAFCLIWPSTSVAVGYVAAIAVALATALLTPKLGELFLRGTGGFMARTLGVTTAMAARNIQASMSRTGIALAAFTVALAMSAAMGTMVSSFRQEVLDWFDATVKADVYISPATAQIDRLEARIDPPFIEELASWPEVATVDTYRGLSARIGEHNTFTAGVQIEVFRQRSVVRMVDGPSADVFLQKLIEGEAGITESLMRRTGLRTGDLVEIKAAGRIHEVRVAGVYRDYSSDRGVILMDRDPWQRAFGERAPNSVALYATAETNIDTLVDSVQRAAAGRYALLVRSNLALRQQGIEVFDRTFTVARALEVIGIAVAALGILAALLAMLLERRRELAVLRTLGVTPRQQDAMLLIEALLLTGMAWLFALFAGTGLSWILLRVINLRSFGWSLPFHPPFGSWVTTLGISLLAAGLASLYPIWRGRRIVLATELRGE